MTTSPVVCLKPVRNRRAFALVFLVIDHANVGDRFHFLENLPRSVRAEIVDEDEFLGNRHFLHSANDFANPLQFVKNGNHDRELEPVRNAIDADLPAGAFAHQRMQHLQPFVRILSDFGDDGQQIVGLFFVGRFVGISFILP